MELQSCTGPTPQDVALHLNVLSISRNSFALLQRIQADNHDSSTILTIIGNRPTGYRDKSHQGKALVQIPLVTLSAFQLSVSPNPVHLCPPTFYMINCVSLAKPHVLEHSTTDLLQYNSDVCLICETWFKAHLTPESVSIKGCNCYRGDIGAIGDTYASF